MGKREDDKDPLIEDRKKNATYKTLESYEEYGLQTPSKSKVKKDTIGIFTHTSFVDHLLILFGTTACIIHGAGFPLLSMVMGGMTIVFLRAENSDLSSEFPVALDKNTATNDSDAAILPISRQEFQSEVMTYSFYYLFLGVAMFLTSYVQIACWESFAERAVHRLRQNYLKALLRQEISWFDKQQSGNLTSRISDDLERVREGIGDKLSLFIQLISTFLAGFGVGFWFNWQLTLAMVVFTPALTITGSWMGKMTATRTKVEQEKYAVAGAIAEETFSSIRTVHALNGEKRELDRYEIALEDGRKTGLVKYMYMGIGVGISFIITYISYAVAFWFAARLVLWGVIDDRSIVFIVFFAVLSGSQSLGGAFPHLASISNAFGAASHVLQVMNAQPTIDPYSESGEVIEHIRGDLEFKSVIFSYPLRRDRKAVDGISFKVEAGKKLALVGQSGCGKSTIVSMLLRFYDPDEGQVCIDGKDLRTLNLRSFRDRIGVVSQEPILFDGSLEENIILGAEWASREDVLRCCDMANATEFINRLSDGLYTRTGELGAQLSGGQKQRIAIARALIRNPQILILDEATSALDTESEVFVQKALDRAQKGRTTIFIAHRLSTIRDADQILVLDKGRIVESGTYDELYESRGTFYSMVNVQRIKQNSL